MIASWQTEERKRCQETDKARVSHLQVLLFRTKSSTFLSLLKKELDNISLYQKQKSYKFCKMSLAGFVFQT